MINVTATDIRLGKRKDPRRCPVFRAIRRSIGGYIYVGNNAVQIRSHPSNVATVVALPMRVDAAITRYDRTGKMKPFSFKLAINTKSKTTL